MRAVWSAEATGRDVVHHAPRIRLGDLDCFITQSLESHPHLRVSINKSIVGESEYTPFVFTDTLCIYYC
jgi:hypothetical protein